MEEKYYYKKPIIELLKLEDDKKEVMRILFSKIDKK